MNPRVDRCPDCGKTTNPQEFSVNNARWNKLGLYCKECESRRVRAWRHANPTKVKRAGKKCYLKKRYGLTEKTLIELQEGQKGLCALCCMPWDAPCIDHDHATGEIRGILCSTCNIWLGVLENHPEFFQQALTYLKKFMNNRIAKIVRDIEYKNPPGSLPEYKYGVKVSRHSAPVQGLQDTDIITPNMGALKRELSKAPSPVKMPDPELIDG